MSYFQDVDIREKLLSNDSETLRLCQHGATLATVGHFTSSNTPAIVSLPTGAGKTELMFSLAFALQASRILIIEPSLFLRRQTAEKLKKLDLFRGAQFIETDDNPNIKQAWKSLGSLDDWNELQSYDAVIATPKTVSPEEEYVSDPPDDLFDLIFIDEAHHAAAKTWRAILKAFPDSKKVLLTATAFRRDRRRIPGKLIYHYPVGRALSDKIYRPIKYLPVHQGQLDEVDSDIASAAIGKLNEEKKINPDAGLLIRTDLILKCSEISQIYSGLGLENVIIHSELGKREAEKRIDKLRDGEVDAAVVVGMMAEGIDIPSLKVAALHSTPRTLPYTLQIVGRVSRNDPNQKGSAWLVAVPTEIRGEARKLFREDRAWHEFVPDLIEDAIQEAHGNRTHAILDDVSVSTIVPEELTPFFSVDVRLFKDTEGKIHDERLPLDLNDVKGMPREVENIEVLASAFKNCTSIITMSAHRPTWGREGDLFDTVHDLHLLYSPDDSQVLFLATTSPKILKALAGALIDEIGFVDPKNLQGALQDAQMSNYSSIGLENALGLTGLHPSYKMHLGAGSGSSIRPSDGIIFGAGHAVGKLRNSSEIRGTSTKNRRIWAMRRESLGEFIGWCNSITNQITTPANGLPGLTFLAQPVPAIDMFLTDPISIVASDTQFS
ncbi:MAG: DEAD/DEAH box helicase family protein, partial [Calditrichaeota bacterium]|nr:DEAD/DEAH box helicase family protein [Calditrichota bacterium]